MFQPDVYVSRTTLVIGTTILDPNPDSGQIYIAQQLAQIYADMARREPIQQATMEALGIDWLPNISPGLCRTHRWWKSPSQIRTRSAHKSLPMNWPAS
jgi:hypothetical protein